MTAAAMLAVTACGGGSEEPHPGARATGGDGRQTGRHRAEARLYAAASLTDAVAAVAKAFEPIRGTRIVPALGASGTLAQQIREGAEPGVFVSASPEWVDRLEEWGLAEPGTRTDLVGNSLVVVVPRGAAWRPHALEDLAAPSLRRLALADPGHVPAGRYARAALEASHVWEAVAPRVVSSPDVRTALAYVERGEADAGVVYATDARGSSEAVTAFAVPRALHPRVVYCMVLVKGANRRAHELHAFLRSAEALAALEALGFERP